MAAAVHTARTPSAAMARRRLDAGLRPVPGCRGAELRPGADRSTAEIPITLVVGAGAVARRSVASIGAFRAVSAGGSDGAASRGDRGS